MQEISKSDISKFIGQHIGTSDWLVVDQDRINTFADVTEDHQFIHIDPKAAAQTPFGGTIAHGFLTLSLLSKLAEGPSLVLKDIKMGVNYGFDKVRFVEPVRAGAKIRGSFTLSSAEEKKPGQFSFVYQVSVEIEGNDRPALTAEWLTLQFI